MTQNTQDEPTDRVRAETFADLEATALSATEATRAAQLLSAGADAVVRVPTWLLEDPDTDLTVADGTAHLAAGEVVDYSEKAWKLLQTDDTRATWGTFLPKSAVTVVELAPGVDVITTPQAGLEAFAGGGDDEPA
jgi:hypothetical protein